jgi:tryptophanyl-tRNA synthetase
MLSLPRQTLRRAAPTNLYRATQRLNSSSSAPAKPKIIFSGIQPTGIPHLGNYLGALREWVKLQDADVNSESTRLFSVVDLHAITIKQSPEKLRLWRKQMLASLIAVGLDPEKSLLFYQSSVPQHAELMWILSCNASMGYANDAVEGMLGSPSKGDMC